MLEETSRFLHLLAQAGEPHRAIRFEGKHDSVPFIESELFTNSGG